MNSSVTFINHKEYLETKSRKRTGRNRFPIRKELPVFLDEPKLTHLIKMEFCIKVESDEKNKPYRISIIYDKEDYLEKIELMSCIKNCEVIDVEIVNVNDIIYSERLKYFIDPRNIHKYENI